MRTAIEITMLILVALFSIGTMAEKRGKGASRLIAGLAICTAGLVALQIFG